MEKEQVHYNGLQHKDFFEDVEEMCFQAISMGLYIYFMLPYSFIYIGG